MNAETKQRIELEHVEINAKFIHVSGSSTTFVNETFKDKINTNLLLKKINQLSKICKERNIKLKGKQKAVSLIKYLEEEYSKTYPTYILLFKKLKALTEEKVAEGIYFGFSDDEKLKQIGDFRNTISKMWHRDTALSQIQEINQTIDKFIERSSDYETNYTMFNIG